MLNAVPNSTTHQKHVLWMLSRCMKAAGFPVLASSNGTTKDTSGVAANDLWGGNVNPLADAYNSAWDTLPIWIVHQGASFIKHTITGAPTPGPNPLGPLFPDFLPGEPVVQATSGAIGEWQGYSFDATNGGHATIRPRTGTFDGTHTVTGSWSGATYTPSAVATYTEQIVIACTTNTTQGYMAVNPALNMATESASAFSTLATSAGCTATVAPGLGGTGNAFPTLAFSVCGDWTVPTANYFFGGNQAIGKAQIEVKDMVGTAYVSPDGSFWCGTGNGGSGATQMEGFGRFLCDGCEPADLYPVAWFRMSQQQYSSINARQICTTNAGLAESQFFIQENYYVNWRSWRKRGMPVLGSYAEGFLPLQGDTISSPANMMFIQTPAVTDRIACSYANTPPRRNIRFELWNSDATGTYYPGKGAKGSPRHLRMAMNLVGYNQTDNLTRLCLCASNSAAVLMSMGDGSTTIVQS